MGNGFDRKKTAVHRYGKINNPAKQKCGNYKKQFSNNIHKTIERNKDNK